MMITHWSFSFLGPLELVSEQRGESECKKLGE
jgi:hypothetical protein